MEKLNEPKNLIVVVFFLSLIYLYSSSPSEVTGNVAGYAQFENLYGYEHHDDHDISRQLYHLLQELEEIFKYSNTEDVHPALENFISESQPKGWTHLLACSNCPTNFGVPGSILVHKSEEFQVELTCWNEEATSIHNHEFQDCWTGVLQGTIVEQYYKIGPNETLIEGEFHIYPSESVSFINDNIALHSQRGMDSAITIQVCSRSFFYYDSFDLFENNTFQRNKINFIYRDKFCNKIEEKK